MPVYSAWADEEEDGDEMESLLVAQKRSDSPLTIKPPLVIDKKFLLRQEMIQLDHERELQHSLIEEREEGIKGIESSIQEVNSIFIDLATLVQEQAPMIGA